MPPRKDNGVEKVCLECGETKPLTEYYVKHVVLADGTKSPQYNSYCRPCFNDRTQAIRVARRQRVFRAYGDACACCGETTVEFLALDHVHGGGSAHRRVVGNNEGVYREVERNGFPDDFQLLCHNCNMAKHIYGTCPHQVTSSDGVGLIYSPS